MPQLQGAGEPAGLLEGKDILVGAIDVASDAVETPEDVAGVVAEVVKHVPKERIQLCTNCGMAPMRRDIAYAKLAALAKGAALARNAVRLSVRPLARIFCVSKRLVTVEHSTVGLGVVPYGYTDPCSTFARPKSSQDWLGELQDSRAKAKVLIRIERLAGGNPGDVEPLGRRRH